MDPVESAKRWHQWSVKGTPDVLTQVLARLDANLPDGWRRLPEEEVRFYLPLLQPATAWYSLSSPPAPAGITLVLRWLSDSELRGGRAWFPAPGCPTPAANFALGWDRIMYFLDNGIVPAAKSAGASVSAPSADDLFLADLPPDVAEELRKFSQSARKLLPLDAAELDVWRAFVIGAFRGEAAIDARPFVEWLVHQGWKREAASELSRRFLEECLLLMRYADEVSAA